MSWRGGWSGWRGELQGDVVEDKLLRRKDALNPQVQGGKDISSVTTRPMGK